MLNDEIPVGLSKKAFMIEEYPPGMVPLQQDYDPSAQEERVDLPLKQRIKSKVWKQRLQAYEELLSEDEVDFDTVTAIVQDIHLACQEKALSVAQKFFEVHKSPDQTPLKEFIRVMIEKVLTQIKLRSKAHQVLVLIFDNGGKPCLFEQIILNLTHKNPKVVQATIALLLELLAQYGPRKLENLKPFFPTLAKLTEAQQTTVKSDAFNFFREATKWFGKAIEAFYGGLSEKHQLELRKIHETEEHHMKPLKGGEESERVALDVYEMVEAVEVFSKFPESWCEKLLKLEKWAEKREQMEVLFKACSAPKLVFNQGVYHVIQMLKRLINDSNINLSTFAIKIVGAIANGLRKHFNQHAKMILESVCAKLKDKKQMVVDETLSTIQKLFFALNLDEMIEELKCQLEDKAPGTRLNVFIVIEMYIDEQSKEKLNRLSCLKVLVILCKKYLEDGNSDVRNKSLVVLAKISAKLYNGNMAIDLKGDRLQKYQMLVSSYDKSSPDQMTEKQPQQQQEKPVEKQTNIPEKPLLPASLPQSQQASKITHPPVQKKAPVQNSDKKQPTPQCVALPSAEMTVEQFFKSYKNRKKDDEFGQFLINLNQKSKEILIQSCQYIVERVQDNRQLCHQIFDKLASQYKWEHISSLINAFRMSPTQQPLTEVLFLLSKYLPSCDKNLELSLVQDFLKQYQQSKNEKILSYLTECNQAINQIFSLVQPAPVSPLNKLPPKQSRMQEDSLNPMPTNSFSDVHFNKLKNYFKIPQIPPLLYDQLFSYNIQKNIHAANMIKMKITCPVDFSDLLIKWAYLISWMKEIVPLHAEIATLYQVLVVQFRKENYTPAQFEVEIIFSYVKMVSLLICRNQNTKFAQRTLPMLMNLLSECQKSGLTTVQLLPFEDFDEQTNAQANELLEAMAMHLKDWNAEQLQGQKLIIAALLGVITKEESIIVAKQQFTFNNGNQTNQSQSEISNDSIKLRMEQLNQIQESNILQPSRIINYPMDIENDAMKVFDQLYNLVMGGQPYESVQVCDLIVKLLRQLYQENNNMRLCIFLDKVDNVTSNAKFFAGLSYQKFYELLAELMNQMLSQIVNNNYQDRKLCDKLNHLQIRIIDTVDLSWLYMGFMDIALLNKQHPHLLTKVLTRIFNKLMNRVKNAFPQSQLRVILERFNAFLEVFSEEKNPELLRYYEYIVKAIKATMTTFFHYNDGLVTLNIIKSINANEQSLMRVWIKEHFEKANLELVNYRRSRDLQIIQVVELLKFDFQGTVDSFVQQLRRTSNKNWRQLVEFLTPSQIGQIEAKLQQNQDLEKKLGELESMLLNQ